MVKEWETAPRRIPRSKKLRVNLVYLKKDTANNEKDSTYNSMNLSSFACC
jgi:hypothetical protein